MTPGTRPDDPQPDGEPVDARLAGGRWTIGATTVTAVVEHQIEHIPPEFFFAEATREAVQRQDWLVPDYADAAGGISLRVQAFVIEVDGFVALVDPCVGNAKVRALPFWHDQNWPFLERLAGAGFSPADVDLVVHTHLHADHVGWDTHRQDDRWVPTFTAARHLYTAADLAYCQSAAMEGEDVYGDSIAPILAAGLADTVASDAELGHGLVLEPSPGHTPGHTSLWVESQGERALITGDFLHHPVQLAEPGWAEIADADIEEARRTRRRMIERAAHTGALVFGTHFAGRPAGRVIVDGDHWRFQPA
jgi:glyoxylase-like metal-dependent hydrolase (beta-lactamase superfamily II)